MKNDINGQSTTQKGSEHYEDFYSATLKKTMVQYDYRHRSGKLFSCVAETLEDARKMRDEWLISFLY